MSSPGIILLVDDEVIVRESGSELLELMGYPTLIAEDGKQAIDVFREHIDEISVVIIDLTMPRMGGVAAFRELRRMKPGIKGILSTGSVDDELRELCDSEGFIGFIRKPYGVDTLRAKLDSALLAGTPGSSPSTS